MRNSLIILSVLFFLVSCGSSSDSQRKITLTPNYPDSVVTFSSNIKAVGAVYSSGSDEADVVAQPVLGKKDSDGNFVFTLSPSGSVVAGQSLFQADFYYEQQSNSSTQNLKNLSSDLSNSIRIAYTTSIITSDNDESFQVNPEDFYLNPDDDLDGMTNLDEILAGLNYMLQDSDGDGVIDGDDAFPSNNTEWADTDSDGIGDNQDDDIDGDGILNNDELIFGTDPYLSDTDEDGVLDLNDNCPVISNEEQLDTDNDGQGDVCEDDRDGDGLRNTEETTYGTNPLNPDTDNDGLGDKTEIDFGYNPLNRDTDSDTIIDGEDNCPANVNADQADLDTDGIGDLCDLDIDGDQVINSDDNCPIVSNQEQDDLDLDGFGDVCDVDIDADDVPNIVDNCDYVPNPDQLETDYDADEIPVECDLDDRDKNVLTIQDGVFVDNTHGLDIYSGKIDSPVATISKAISLAIAKNKKIYVAAGVYDVGNVIWQSGVQLFGGFRNSSEVFFRFSSRNTLSTNEIYQTILTRDDSDITIDLLGVTDVLISGFRIINESIVDIEETDASKTIRLNNSNIDLQKNRILGNESLFRTFSVYADNSQINVVQNFINPVSNDDDGSEAIALYLYKSEGLLANNIIESGTANFVRAIVLEQTDLSIINNTILNTVELYSSSPEFINNLVLSQSTEDPLAIDCREGLMSSESEFRNNLLISIGALSNYVVRGCGGELYNDEVFVLGEATIADNIVVTSGARADIIDGSYNLVGPGIDDGLVVELIDDFYGDARPQGTGFDIGAIEN